MKKALCFITALAVVITSCDLSLYIDKKQVTPEETNNPSFFIPELGSFFSEAEHQLKVYIPTDTQTNDNTIAEVVKPGIKKASGAVLEKAVVNVHKYNAHYSATLYYNDVVEKWSTRSLNEAEKKRWVDYNNAATFVQTIKSWYNDDGSFYPVDKRHVFVTNSNIFYGITINNYNTFDQSFIISPITQYNSMYAEYIKVASTFYKPKNLLQRQYLTEKEKAVNTSVKNTKYATDFKDSQIEQIVPYLLSFNNSAFYSYSEWNYIFTANPTTPNFNYILAGYYFEKIQEYMCDYIKFNRLEINLIPEYTIKSNTIYTDATFVERYDIVSPQKIVFYFKPDTNWGENFLKVKGNVLTFSYDVAANQSYTYTLNVE